MVPFRFHYGMCQNVLQSLPLSKTDLIKIKLKLFLLEK